MPKRFNNLDAALKFLRPVNAAPGTAIPSAPAGTALAQYQDYKAGQVIVTYTRAATSNPGSIDRIAIKPFALPGASTDTYNVGFTGKGAAAFSTFGLTAALLGHAAPAAGTILSRGFKPAKAVCVNVPTGAGTSTPSKITGQRYNKKAASGRTFPFGRGTADPYSTQKQAILSAVANAGTTLSVSFKPEVF
ncbi:MAG TPA: hypothetical protein VE956_20070 [Nodularia sp. (in: cyanobacteria)]|nr:hypothetical protein [Nodularia sp. (in: cyanobacteria)]